MVNKLPLPSLSTLSTVLDSVEMVKKAWASFSLPTQFAPTMDVDELDKRIADLKAVEQWLNLNLSMLRGTIQGLEIQRGALAAVKAFGKAVAPATSSPSPSTVAAPPPPAPPPALAPAPTPSALNEPAALLANPAGWWNLLQSQFNQVAQAALAGSGLASSLAGGARPAPKAKAKTKAKVKIGTGTGASGTATARKKAAPRRTRRPPDAEGR